MKHLIILGLLVLVACTPAVTTSDTVELLKQACNTCDVESSVPVSLRQESQIYTTRDAICIRDGNQLSCGTCSCALNEQTLATGPANVTCSFSPGETLSVKCA